MYEIILAFFAGVLTILAPCVLPILPIILGNSASTKSIKKPVTIIVSLALSIFLISILLIIFGNIANIRTEVLTKASGVILVLYGIILIFPHLWDQISLKLNLSKVSDEALNSASKKEGFWGDVLIGFALGPIFNSCSPVYFIIILPLLQKSLFEGIGFLLAYLLGLVLVLVLISIFGFTLTRKLKWAVNPNGKFRKALGIVFIIIGVMIFFSLEKQFEAYLLQNSEFYFTILNFERELIN